MMLPCTRKLFDSPPRDTARAYPKNKDGESIPFEVNNYYYDAESPCKVTQLDPPSIAAYMTSKSPCQTNSSNRSSAAYLEVDAQPRTSYSPCAVQEARKK